MNRIFKKLNYQDQRQLYVLNHPKVLRKKLKDEEDGSYKNKP
jgi:hypothetical protein